MIIEYAGVADRWAGPGVVHEVRAWWNVHETTEGQVKRAALDALCPANGVTVSGSAEVIGVDTSTYSTPHLNAMVRIRVLTIEEAARRTELRARRYTHCDGDDCPNTPGQLVHMFDDPSGQPERALCWTCWRPLARTVQCKVLHWIQADGKLQVF